ncbi:hypothetical protein DFA_04612 [Cavenderia fasciculata]|uniref:Uncharacterized protein n=1 Tax=Cavenderia fasciculata TaxID=261658 RepID=F4PQ21_CACFS|nr:uncharacterized protein DFA_04612 [Cavenderia fasciculata]EGG22484.1 hypothetical protein DFA_04612 [Cavenderia fasciculata]|eukprot:XP_004360335.1 hypothetical protein DFA_04612 [Cavenderia fasciculata]
MPNLDPCLPVILGSHHRLDGQNPHLIFHIKYY